MLLQYLSSHLSSFSRRLAVLGRVLQRNRTNGMHLGIDTDTEIYYKELVHVLMEAEKSQDLQLANWRPRRAGGIVPKA